jgi:hypothetical protein
MERYPPVHEREAFRGEIRLIGVRRVSHGLGVPKCQGLSTDEELVRDLRAYLLVLPESAVFTHLTAARLRGWDLPKLPEAVPVWAAVAQRDPRPRRNGLICSRLVDHNTRTSKPDVIEGLPVEKAEEILLRAARDLGLLDLLILLESALHHDDIDIERMAAILDSGRPGVRMLREAWRRATGKCDSPGETLLQQFHKVIKVPFKPQAELFDKAGRFVGQADLLVTGTAFVHEYDGEYHRGKAQQRTDLRRGRGIADTSYTRKGFTLDDLLNHPLVVMHEIDRSLGRPHDPSRIDEWRRLVGNSFYDERGRERVMNRWRRQSQLIDWTRAV